jgi:putative sterol carrier protein
MYNAGSEDWEKKYAKLVKDRIESQSKPYMVLSPEWASEMEEKIQNDERYKAVAKTWEGSVTLVFKADSASGLDADLFVFMDLWHGQCHSVKMVPGDLGRSADYVLEASYERWKRVLKKDLNVVKEIATNKLKLVPFNFKKAAKLASAAQAAIRLVDLAGEVSDKFPDESEPEAFLAFKAFLEELKTNFGI